MCDLRKHWLLMLITASKTCSDLRKHRVLMVMRRRYGHSKTCSDLRICLHQMHTVSLFMSARETKQTDGANMPRSSDPIHPRGSTAQHNFTSKPCILGRRVCHGCNAPGAHHAHGRGRVHASHVFDHNRLLHLRRITWNGQK